MRRRKPVVFAPPPTLEPDPVDRRVEFYVEGEWCGIVSGPPAMKNLRRRDDTQSLYDWVTAYGHVVVRHSDLGEFRIVPAHFPHRRGPK